MLTTLHDFSHDMRIGNMSARHADHVHLARRNSMPRRRYIRNPRGMKRRKVGGRANLTGKIQMR